MDVCQDERTRGCVLVVATLASFLPPFMASSINIALPAIGEEFSIDAVLLGWIATSYLLSSAVLMVPFGKYADIYGMKRIFILGLAVFTISSLLAAEALSSLFLIASRVVQGIGAAMIFGTSTAILVRAYPIAERGRVLGINAASVYLGLSLGPFLGGLLTQYLGWRSLFLVSVPLGLVPLALAAFMLKDERAGAGEDELDLVGSLTYSIMLISVMYGFSRLPSALGAALVLGGFIVLLLLIRWEARVRSPVLDISLFRGNRVYAFSNLAALINYSATFAVTFLLSLYLQYIKGLQPDEAGLILVAQPLVMTLLSPYTGMLSDRMEPRLVATAGMVLTFLGVMALVSLGLETDLAFIVCCLLVIGAGLSLFTSPNTNAIMSSIEPRFYGVGSATLGTMRLVGQVSSMGIAMMVFSVFLGNAEVSPEHFTEFLLSIKTAFMIFGSLCILGTFASMARGHLDR